MLERGLKLAEAEVASWCSGFHPQMLFGDDGTFSIRVLHSGSVELVDVTGSMTVHILKDKLKNEVFCNVPRSTSHDQMFLQLDQKGFTDECATLESLGVSPDVLLEFSCQRSRGGKRDRQSSLDHQEAFITIQNKVAAGKDTTKPFGWMMWKTIESIRAMREVLQLKVRPPPEWTFDLQSMVFGLEDEEGIGSLTSNQMQWLEVANDALTSSAAGPKEPVGGIGNPAQRLRSW